MEQGTKYKSHKIVTYLVRGANFMLVSHMPLLLLLLLITLIITAAAVVVVVVVVVVVIMRYIF
jgi:hypothetical protein